MALFIAEGGDLRQTAALDDLAVLGERMPGEIDTGGLLFQLQELEKIELLHLGQDLPHRHRLVR